jgi:RNA polymerase sigma-32 factor
VIRSYSLVGGGSGPLRSKVFFKLRRERARLAAMLGDKEEEEAALAGRMGVSVEQVRGLLARIEHRDLSLSTPRYDGARESLEDLLEDEGEGPEEVVARREALARARARIDEALSHLDARERLIVHHRILADTPLSLAAIGRRLGVSRERARQLEARAKGKLRMGLSELGDLAA